MYLVTEQVKLIPSNSISWPEVKKAKMQMPTRKILGVTEIFYIWGDFVGGEVHLINSSNYELKVGALYCT